MSIERGPINTSPTPRPTSVFSPERTGGIKMQMISPAKSEVKAVPTVKSTFNEAFIFKQSLRPEVAKPTFTNTLPKEFTNNFTAAVAQRKGESRAFDVRADRSRAYSFEVQKTKAIRAELAQMKPDSSKEKFIKPVKPVSETHPVTLPMIKTDVMSPSVSNTKQEQPTSKTSSLVAPEIKRDNTSFLERFLKTEFQIEGITIDKAVVLSRPAKTIEDRMLRDFVTDAEQASKTQALYAQFYGEEKAQQLTRETFAKTIKKKCIKVRLVIAVYKKYLKEQEKKKEQEAQKKKGWYQEDIRVNDNREKAATLSIKAAFHEAKTKKIPITGRLIARQMPSVVWQPSKVKSTVLARGNDRSYTNTVKSIKEVPVIADENHASTVVRHAIKDNSAITFAPEPKKATARLATEDEVNTVLGRHVEYTVYQRT